MSKGKRGKGQFYTRQNPFELTPFLEWLLNINKFSEIDILEPFAGQNNIPKFLRDSGLTNNFVCYDIEPQKSVLDGIVVHQRDTINVFPTGYTLTITNPPFLSKSSASRHKLEFPENCEYDDIYKLCLSLMLENVPYVASIVPESFITSGKFRDRLHTYISLTGEYFTDTETPIGLALFNKEVSDDFIIYRNEEKLGEYKELQVFDVNNNKLDNILNVKIIFNNPHGKLGLHAIDGTNKKIRFVNGSEINHTKIKHYSRTYSRITLTGEIMDFIDMNELIIVCNEILERYSNKTDDVFLTSFKNKNNSGLYRRRIDWKTTRNIILLAVHKIINKKLTTESIKSKYF